MKSIPIKIKNEKKLDSDGKSSPNKKCVNVFACALVFFFRPKVLDTKSVFKLFRSVFSLFSFLDLCNCVPCISCEVDFSTIQQKQEENIEWIIAALMFSGATTNTELNQPKKYFQVNHRERRKLLQASSSRSILITSIWLHNLESQIFMFNVKSI